MNITTPDNLNPLSSLADNDYMLAWDSSEISSVKLKKIQYDNFYATIANNKNYLINSGFDFWQRALSQSVTGYGSDDRWLNACLGSSIVHSQQSFTVGQTDVPDNPRYFSRTVVTSSAGSGNYAFKVQRLENVSTLSGSTATFSFWAKADSAKDIAVEFAQSFGTGGSPSSFISGIGVTTFSLTTSWQKFITTVSISSISGKTLGTDGNDSLRATFWFDAGSDFNARTNSLGQQSGTFDIAQVQLEKGSIATSFEVRHPAIELMLCQRYYEVAPGITFTAATADNTRIIQMWYFAVPKRNTPTITITNSVGTVTQTGTLNTSCVRLDNTVIGTQSTATVAADSEL